MQKVKVKASDLNESIHAKGLCMLQIFSKTIKGEY